MTRRITDIVSEGEALGVVGGVAASIPIPADQTAAGVAFTPAGTIAATDVQAAIEEVAAEAGGSPAAAAVSIVDAGGYYTGTDVEAALQEIGAGGTGGATAGIAAVNTNQSTTSTTYADLATVGPSVTIDVPASGQVYLLISAGIESGVAGGACYMGVALSGANVAAAADTSIIHQAAAAGYIAAAAAAVVLTGLTAGSTTFTAKYRVGSSTGNFRNRKLVAVPA